MIYADNAATTKLDIDAFEAMKPWLLDEYGNASQPYSFARKPKKALAEAREIVAGCINAKPEEIYFTSGGTESDNWAIKSAAFSDPEHRAIITSAFEHHAILHSCEAIERMGYPVVYLFPNASGQIQTSVLKSHITGRTRLVSIMFANNELGSIQPVQELAEIAHINGSVFHTDAVQAVGHVPIDVEKLGIDLLSASAHKFNGPKGVGFLYRRAGLVFPPYMDGGAQEKHLRAGTENIASIVGMAVALKKNCDDLEKSQVYLNKLEEVLLGAIEKAGLRYIRNGGSYTLPGLLSLSFPGFSGEAILHRMDLMGICISTGSACDSVNTEISHVLKAVKLDEELARGTIRISLSKQNTIDDVDAIANALIKITKKD